MAVGMPAPDTIISAEWQVMRIFRYGPVSGADIDVSPRSLDFPFIAAGKYDTMAVTVESNGTEPLIIRDFAFTSDEFTAYPVPPALAPGEKSEINVIYHAGEKKYRWNHGGPE